MFKANLRVWWGVPAIDAKITSVAPKPSDVLKSECLPRLQTMTSVPLELPA
jgi:hypothetical protein